MGCMGVRSLSLDISANAFVSTYGFDNYVVMFNLVPFLVNSVTMILAR